MKQQKNHTLSNRISLIIVLICLIIGEFSFSTLLYGAFHIKDGSYCTHDQLVYNISNLAYYISIISFIILVVLLIVFIKKSDKFIGVLIVVGFIFAVVIPCILIFVAGAIHNSDECRIGQVWENVFITNDSK